MERQTQYEPLFKTIGLCLDLFTLNFKLLAKKHWNHVRFELATIS